MEFGPDDLVELAFYYLPGLIFAVVLSITIFAMGLFAKRLQAKLNLSMTKRVLFAFMPLVCWIFYCTLTFNFAVTLVSLNSESAGLAEHTYQTTFKEQVNTLDKALALAVNKRQPGDVRFYASCLLAEMLTNCSDAKISAVLQEVDGAREIDTEFLGMGRHILTCPP
jgi:hypothetical protein